MKTVNTLFFPDPKGETMREGITMRQYYKAMASIGILAGWDSPNGCSFAPDAVASRAGSLADAMIEEDIKAAQS